MSKRLEQCPLCNAQNLLAFITARDRHYGIPGNFTLERCLDCGLVFLNPMYSDDELAAMYPTDYYSYQRITNPGRGKQFLKRILGYEISTKDPGFSRPGRVLDIGCGSGWFLRRFRDAGWQTHGVEINKEAAKVGRELDGLDIFSGTVSEARFSNDCFDYIRLNHSFEHMTCPNETLTEIHRILKPEGLLMIGVPNHAGLNAKLFGRYWWYLGAPVHPFTYTATTLSRMLEKNNFRVEKVAYNSDYGGSLGSFQIWLNRNTDLKSTEGRFINSTVLRVFSHWLAKVTNLVRVGDAIEITASKSPLHVQDSINPAHMQTMTPAVTSACQNP